MTAQRPIPQWKLERYVLRELDANELSTLDRLRLEDPGFAAQIQALQESNKQILDQLDPKAYAQRIQSRAMASKTQKAKHTAPYVRGLLVFATTILLAFVFAPTLLQGPNSVLQDPSLNDPHSTRLKGLGNHLELWQKTGDSVALLLEGARLKAGDVVQVRYRLVDTCYAAIVSLDGNGKWTTHFPESGPQAPRLAGGPAVILPYSYELDSAPRYEVFWLITSSKPFRVDSIIQVQPKNHEPLPTKLLLGKSFGQERLAILKGAKP